jgi:hypothetical protein
VFHSLLLQEITQGRYELNRGAGRDQFLRDAVAVRLSAAKLNAMPKAELKILKKKLKRFHRKTYQNTFESVLYALQKATNQL